MKLVTQVTVLIVCATLGALALSSPARTDWKIKSDVDLYKEPGGKGKPVGIVRKNRTFLDEQVDCRGDKWCHIPPGWVWGTFLKKVKEGADDEQAQSTKTFKCFATNIPAVFGDVMAKNEDEAIAKFKKGLSPDASVKCGLKT